MTFGVMMFLLGMCSGMLVVAVAFLIGRGLPSGMAPVYNVSAFHKAGSQKATDRLPIDDAGKSP